VPTARASTDRSSYAVGPDPPPGTSAILQATSRPTGAPRMDLELARRVIGYVPRDAWPEGLPFPVT
jgi:hypothetical protein